MAINPTPLLIGVRPATPAEWKSEAFSAISLTEARFAKDGTPALMVVIGGDDLPTAGYGYAMVLKDDAGLLVVPDYVRGNLIDTFGSAIGDTYTGYLEQYSVVFNRVATTPAAIERKERDLARFHLLIVPGLGTIDETEARQLFDYGFDRAQTNLITRLNTQLKILRINSTTGAQIVSGLEGSKELIALLSLQYHGVVGGLLTKAIVEGRRADAWYEIRYGSNNKNPLPNKPSNFDKFAHGTAKRRYFESEIFGLYDNGSPIPAEATAVYDMYTRAHKTKILPYENAYSSELQNGVADYLDTAVKRNLRLNSVVSLSTLEKSLTPAANVLKAMWLTDPRNTLIRIDDICPLDIQLATTGNVVLDGHQRSGYQLGVGAERQDLLIGSLGADTLRGNGGSDAIIGGGGADSLYGGDGADFIYSEGGAFIDGGAGADVIVLTGSGRDKIVWGPDDGQDVVFGDPLRPVTILRRDGAGAEAKSFAGVFFRDNSFGAYTYVADESLSVRVSSPAVLTLGNGSITFQNLTSEALVNQGLAGIRLITMDTVTGGSPGETFFGDNKFLDANLSTPAIEKTYDSRGNIVRTTQPDADALDEFIGTTNNDTIDGRGGSDTLRGDGGNDSIIGGAGRDRIAGDLWWTDPPASGVVFADTIEAGGDADIVFAGPGDDRVYGDQFVSMSDLYNDRGQAVGTGVRGDLQTIDISA